MESARDLTTGSIVVAERASQERHYVCCRPGCGARVYLPHVAVQRPHFRHYPGEGTLACEEYVPGAGNGREPVAIGVEDGPTELGLIVDRLDGAWCLGVRLPEIPHDELAEGSLKDLQLARVEVAAASGIVTCISALDLRPGIGAARVQIQASTQEYRSRTVGSWPDSIDTSRWELRTRGLEARGTLFRLHVGEWTRLAEASALHTGERLLVLADARLSPPNSIVIERHAEIASGGLRWTMYEVLLPDEPQQEVMAWLGRLRHEIVPSRWALALATPPRGLDGSGTPTFWIGDSVVLALGAPQAGLGATLVVQLGMSTSSSNIRAPESQLLHLAIKSTEAKHAHIDVSAEVSATIDVAFVERPSRLSLLTMLATTRCLRVWLDDQLIEAWRTPTCKVHLTPNSSPKICVDLGVNSARAHVTLWERGKQRSSRCLDSRNVARVIQAALPSASRIEVDAGNLGSLEIIPMHVATTRTTPASHRLAWYDHVVSLIPPTAGHGTSTILQRPRVTTSLAVRKVRPATLLRGRQALRRRHEVGGDR